MKNDIKKIVQLAISEDIGDGDLTSTLLENKMIVAEIVCRENAVICGIDFANLCFLSIDPKIQITCRPDGLARNNCRCHMRSCTY